MPDSVTVKSLHWFRGQEGEGDNGMVKPGDTLTVDKRRAAELRANGLVEKASGDETEAAPAEVGQPAIAQPVAAPKPVTPTPVPAPAKAETLTTATVAPKPAAPAAPVEVKK